MVPVPPASLRAPGLPAEVTGLQGLSGVALVGIAQIWKRQGRTLTARFGGSSMRPTIAPGAELTFRCGDTVDVGDVAVVVHRGHILVHRVVARSAGGWLLTRGDGTWVPDPPIAHDDVVGRVTLLGAEDVGVPLAAAPSGPWRAFVLAVSVAMLRVGPRAGRRWIGALWFCRFWLDLAPRALVRRLRGGSRSSEEEE
jgi:hypothetical protein